MDSCLASWIAEVYYIGGSSSIMHERFVMSNIPADSGTLHKEVEALFLIDIPESAE
jgi:hypothetical protein